MAYALLQCAFVAPTVLLYQDRALKLALIRREILEHNVGLMLGALWKRGGQIDLDPIFPIC